MATLRFRRFDFRGQLDCQGCNTKEHLGFYKEEA